MTSKNIQNYANKRRYIEIVGTDDQTSSRIIINANFRSLRDAVKGIDERLERIELLQNDVGGVLVNRTFIGFPIVNDVEVANYGVNTGDGLNYIPIDNLVSDGLFLENALDLIIVGVENNHALIQSVIRTLAEDGEGTILGRLNDLEESEDLIKKAVGFTELEEEQFDSDINDFTIDLYQFIKQLQEEILNKNQSYGFGKYFPIYFLSYRDKFQLENKKR